MLKLCKLKDLCTYWQFFQNWLHQEEEVRKKILGSLEFLAIKNWWGSGPVGVTFWKDFSIPLKKWHFSIFLKSLWVHLHDVHEWCYLPLMMSQLFEPFLTLLYFCLNFYLLIFEFQTPLIIYGCSLVSFIHDPNFILSGLVRGWSGWSIDHPRILDVTIAKP